MGSGIGLLGFYVHRYLATWATILVPLQAVDIDGKTMFFDETLAKKWNKKQKLTSFYEEASIAMRLGMSWVWHD